MGNSHQRSILTTRAYDESFQTLLQNEGEETIPIIKRILTASYAWIHILTEWWAVKVLFIQNVRERRNAKAGKAVL